MGIADKMGDSVDRQQPKALTEKTVGEMGVEEFLGLLMVVLEQKKVKGDQRLMEMSAKEFTDFILGQMKTKAYATAGAEADVAQQILTDWQALLDVGAVAQPFRCRTRAEAEQWCLKMLETFTPGFRGHLVVAVGVANPNGTYGPTPPSLKGL